MSIQIGVVSLGCAKNLVDTEIMLGYLTKQGYELVSDPASADFIIVNTCGFIEAAKEESIGAILEMAEMKKSGSCRGLIVTGCLSQRYADDLFREIPEIDGLLGTNELDRVGDVIDGILRGERVRDVSNRFFSYEEDYNRVVTTGSHLAYLKIAEGCSHSCAFCVIPKIRGKYRSRTPEAVIREARSLARQSVKELVVIAQDTTAYGYDLPKEMEASLTSLLQSLSQLDFAWIRLLYTYPTSLSDEVLHLIQSQEKMVKYVDLPLQHVSGKILRKMKRPGDYDSTVRLITKIREMIPGVTIRSSFIVGFPGETEADFRELLSFLEEMRLDHVGIFKYSQEEDTTAFSLEQQIPEGEKERRYKAAMELQQRISLKLNQKLVGREVDVIIDGVSDESDLVLVARHAGQAPDVDGVVYLGQSDVEIGQIVRVRIVEAHPYDLVGEVVE
jgi:ribosomal protein S12 methylthiotransferase